jgi:hypothetical protein
MILFGRIEQLIPLNRSVSKYLFVFWTAKPLVCLSLGVLSLWLAVVSRRSGGDASTPARLAPGSADGAR